LKGKVNNLPEQEIQKYQVELKLLEKILDFEDIRFYRYIVESKIAQNIQGFIFFFFSFSFP